MFYQITSHLLKNITPTITPHCFIIPVSIQVWLSLWQGCSQALDQGCRLWRLDGSWRIPCQAHSCCCQQEVSVPRHVGLSIRLLRTQLQPEQGIQEKEKRIPTQKPQSFHNVTSEAQLFLLMIFYSLESSHWNQYWEWREELSLISWREEYQNLWTYLYNHRCLRT